MKGKLIGQGRTADVFGWAYGQILKLYHDWMPAAAVEQEFDITKAAQAAGLPVPIPYELVELEGKHGIVFERIEGISMMTAMQTQPWRLISLARQFAELHAQMHQVPAAPSFPSQHKQISAGIAAAQDLSEIEKQIVQAALLNLPEGDVICHGDFHPDNIILSKRGPIIIDWMTGTCGTPLADVARTSMLIQIGGLPPGIPLPMQWLTNLLRRLLNAVYLHRYLQLQPLNHQQMEQWRLPILAARLRESTHFPKEGQSILRQLHPLIKENQSD